MSQSWLQRQRKQALLELASEAGLPQDEDQRKDEIVENLHAHLQQNAASLSRLSAFEDYFGKRRATPGRPARDSVAVIVPSSEEIEVKSAVKQRGKRPVTVKSEPEDSGPASSPVQAIVSQARSVASAAREAASSALSPSAQLTARTPAAARPPRRTSTVPGPPSPSAVADYAEDQSSAVASRARALYASSGITECIESLRDQCSSVNAVQMTFLLVEAFALQTRIMPWRFAFDVPSTALTPHLTVFYPDLFALLTGAYWSATLLWSATSIIVPVAFAYFYNLTLRDVRRRDGVRVAAVPRQPADPLTYNVVKALATWLVYVRSASFGGLVRAEVAERVDAAILGGSTAVLVGSGIGALAALYEAAQRRTT